MQAARASHLPRSAAGRRERGAAAVEMALVLPVLLFVLFAMIDFGRAYSAQIQLSQAAREGVRLASLNTTSNTADANYGNTAIAKRVSDAAVGLPPKFAASCSAPTAISASACITYCPVVFTSSSTATVVLTYKFTWVTGISAISKFFGPGTFPKPTTLQSTGVMRCTG